MIEGVLLFLLGIGALLVSVVSILRMAWLAVMIPMLIAGGAAYVLLLLSGRGHRTRQTTKHTNRSAAQGHCRSEGPGPVVLASRRPSGGS